VKSQIATKFRQWATLRLREYIIKGYAMDDQRLKESGGGNYWKTPRTLLGLSCFWIITENHF
jgi:hypothetical protein